MREFCALMTMVFMTLFAVRYAWLLYKKDEKIKPALSMWVIFFTGTITSFATYMVAEKKDVLSGIQNTADLGVVIILVISILFWGDRKTRFQKFEKKYLVFAGMIFLFWIVSGNAVVSNVLTQILMTWGYFPGIQSMIEKKKNTESFLGWGLVETAQIFALFPALSKGNTLSVIYDARAIIVTAVLLGFMAHYHFKGKIWGLKKLYQRMRTLIFSQWWLPTKEQMKQISSRYGYKVRFVIHIKREVIASRTRIFGFQKKILAVNKAIGFCSFREKLMVISAFDHRVFWHELGHALTNDYFGKSLIFSIPFFGWVIDETIATAMGFKLNSYWKRLAQ